MTTMNFILEGRDRLSDVLNRVGDSAIRLHRRLDDTGDHGAKALEGLKKTALSLAPAIIPAAAAMAPLVASTAAAGVAVAAYGAALGPQIAAMAEAGEAEKKYNDAVDKSGRSSKEAVQAHEEYRQAMAKLPPETRRAAAGLSVLKDQYKAWSDGLAKDTMGPVTKGMAIFGGLLPKLTPLVRGTSTELNRMMTLLGGGMQSPGFDKLIGKFTEFSTGVLRRANDGIVHLVRTLDTGKVGGGLSEFLAYAKAQGPVVGDTLKNIGQALMNLLKAGSDVGVGMLQAVNVLSKLVAAVPPGVITALLQLAVAIRVTKLAMIGLGASRAAIAAFGAQLLAMRTAAGGASGGLASFTAALGAMSRGAKIALAGTAIGLLVMGISQLWQMGQRAVPDVDRLTTSLGNLGRTGRVTGELAKSFGKDLSGLEDSLRVLARPDLGQGIDRWISNLIKIDTPEIKAAKKDIDAVDKALAGLVKNGQADLAAAALQRTAGSFKNLTSGELDKELGDYKSALEDMKFEAQLVADSMGLFGAQAQATSAKLAAQKQSADGLRQAIQALNDVNRAGIGGMIGFEAAIDAGTKAAKENAGSLKMVNGVLQLGSEKSRTAASALNDLAAKTDEAAGSARDNGASWRTVNGIYERGRKQLIANGQQMGLTKTQAKALADQILKTPNKTAMLKGDVTDLKAKIKDAQVRLKNAPMNKKAAIRAELAALYADLRKAQGAVNALHGTTITSHHYLVKHYDKIEDFRGAHGRAGGGPIRGPGTRTSDSIPLWGSDGEYMVQAKSVDKYGLPFMDALNEGRLATAMPARAAAGHAATPGLAAPVRQTVVQNINITIPGLIVDPMGTAQQIDTVLAKYKRDRGGGQLTFEKG